MVSTAALALALAIVVAPAPPPTASTTPPTRPALKPAATTRPAVTRVRPGSGFSAANLAPFVRILSPASGANLAAGSTVTFRWNAIKLATVTLELVYPATSSAPERIVKLHEGPATPGSAVVAIRDRYAALAYKSAPNTPTYTYYVDGAPTLRARAVAEDGRTVVDERPVRVLLPTVTIQQPAPGLNVKVGTSVLLRWAFPRAVPPQVRIFVGRPRMSSFDSETTWWGPQVATAAAGSCSFVIPAAALHPGLAPDKYHLRVEGMFDQSVVGTESWPVARVPIVLLP